MVIRVFDGSLCIQMEGLIRNDDSTGSGLIGYEGGDGFVFNGYCQQLIIRLQCDR